MTKRFLAILLCLFAALAVSGDSAIESPRPGESVYLIVLGDSGKEPDVAGHGGRLLRSWSGRRLVALSAEGLAAMREHKGVAYIQRIWTGDGTTAEVSLQSLPGTPATNAAAPAWSTGTYRYDPSGNVKEMGSDTYTYDSVGRVTGATVQGQAQSFNYDPYGNIKELGAKTLTVDTATNRLHGQVYDAAGNVTTDAKGRRYHYDAVGMVTAIGLVTGDSVLNDQRMIYTADDERIVIAEGTTTRYRVRDIDRPLVLREWKSSGTVLEWERDYIYAAGDLVAGEVQVGPHRNSLRHYHRDHLGTVRMVTDGARELVARHDYFPFGEEVTSTITEHTNTGKGPRDPMKFTAHERDYFGLANDADADYVDYMHARYYAPLSGRFMSVDPTWASADVAEPQTWNRYAYVTNNPITYSDPDGKDRLAKWLLKDPNYQGSTLGALLGPGWSAQLNSAMQSFSESPSTRIVLALTQIFTGRNSNQRVGRQRATDASNRAATEIKNTPGKKPATIVGATDRTTGTTVVGKSKPGADGCCAETDAANKLGGDPKNIDFSKPVRPRTGQEIPVCTDCQKKFDKSQFPPDTKFDRPSSESDRKD